jgi:hypothetical protein
MVTLKNHAEITLHELRESLALREIFEKIMSDN